MWCDPLGGNSTIIGKVSLAYFGWILPAPPGGQRLGNLDRVGAIANSLATKPSFRGSLFLVH